MGKLGDALSGISGKDALKGFSAAFGGLPGQGGGGGFAGGLSGLGLAGNPASGLGLMQMLFDKLGVFGHKDKKEEDTSTPAYDPSGIVGPR